MPSCEAPSSHGNTSHSASEEPVKLASTVVMAKSAKAVEEAVAADVERLQGAIQVNSNEQILTYEDEQLAAAATEEDYIAMGKSKKKAKKVRC